MQMYNTKKWKVVAAMLVVAILLLSNTSTALAGAIDRPTECVDNGGTWEAADIVMARVRARPARIGSQAGTCTYPVGNALSVANCGAGYKFTQSYDAFGVLYSQSCILVEEPVPQYGECNDKQEGATDSPVILVPCSSNGGTATFAPGSCATNCTVSTQLHSEANAALPRDAIATLYVMVRGEDGEPSNDSYLACFSNPEGLRLAIYRFVSGGWRTLVISSANPICASVSGDGAFYLGPADVTLSP